jgi:hypothetical protein
MAAFSLIKAVAPTLDRSRCGSMVDGLVPTALKTHQPGAVVVIVKDGQVLLEKAMVSTTAFRSITRDLCPGSTSKLFTGPVVATVEQGKPISCGCEQLSRHQDAGARRWPVTLREIMTFRAGFRNHP